MDVNSIAQEIVEATAPIVSERTINIMDKSGIIIASSDPKRIGTFHKGAAEVIANKKAVRIYKQNVPNYEGAKEGINLPIIISGNILGVVGIYGNPDEVSDVANLLRVYVGQYFAQSALIKKEQLKNDLRSQLLNSIIMGQKLSPETLKQFCSVINVEIKFPIRTVVIHLGNKSTDRVIKFKALNRIMMILTTHGIIDLSTDICGIVDECFVILKSGTDILLDNIYHTVKSSQSLTVCATMGETSNSFEHIQQSYREALILALSKDDGYYSIDDNNTKLSYLMYSLEKADRMSFINKMYNRLLEHFEQKDIGWVIATIQTYCDTNGSINKSSAVLHIHKNTMLYRMNKIFSLMHIEESDKFTKDCFLRVLLVHHNCIKG